MVNLPYVTPDVAQGGIKVWMHMYALRSFCTIERSIIKMPCRGGRCECMALCAKALIEFGFAAVWGCTCSKECEEGKQRKTSDWVEIGPGSQQQLSLNLCSLLLVIGWKLPPSQPHHLNSAQNTVAAGGFKTLHSLLDGVSYRDRTLTDHPWVCLQGLHPYLLAMPPRFKM